jgi:hypothetical protein
LTLKDQAITAGRRGAIAQALVGVDIVAIITELLALDRSVTASRRLTGVAVIGWVVVAVIAALARADHPIAAARLGAGAQARIRVILVAIITGFVAHIA